MQVDRDEDGFIALQELVAYFTAQSVDADPAEALAQDDANADGKISWEEFSGPKGTHSEVHDEL